MAAQKTTEPATPAGTNAGETEGTETPKPFTPDAEYGVKTSLADAVPLGIDLMTAQNTGREDRNGRVRQVTKDGVTYYTLQTADQWIATAEAPGKRPHAYVEWLGDDPSPEDTVVLVGDDALPAIARMKSAFEAQQRAFDVERRTQQTAADAERRALLVRELEGCDGEKTQETRRTGNWPAASWMLERMAAILSDAKRRKGSRLEMADPGGPEEDLLFVLGHLKLTTTFGKAEVTVRDKVQRDWVPAYSFPTGARRLHILAGGDTAIKARAQVAKTVS